MGCKEETKIIDGKSFYCRQWSAEKALLMKLKLIKAFGAPLAELIGVFLGSGIDFKKDLSKIDVAEIPMAGISKVLNDLLTQNEPEVLLALMKEVVESATCDKERITVANFEKIFGDSLSIFYKVFLFVLMVNFKDFLGGKLGQLTSHVEQAVSTSTA